MVGARQGNRTPNSSLEGTGLAVNRALHIGAENGIRTRANGLGSRYAATTSSPRNGGDSRTRTDGMLLAKQPLYQLSYIPRENWSELRDLNPRLTAPKAVALPGCAKLRMEPGDGFEPSCPLSRVLITNQAQSTTMRPWR